jgi:hypothetical protein
MMSPEKQALSMQKITLGLSVHRPEMIHFIADRMQQHDAIFLEEPSAADWIPETVSIDSELEDGMRHFFSDYQHITKEFNRINQKMDRLQDIDQDIQPHLYQHTIGDILKKCNRRVALGDEHENIG